MLHPAFSYLTRATVEDSDVRAGAIAGQALAILQPGYACCRGRVARTFSLVLLCFVYVCYVLSVRDVIVLCVSSTPLCDTDKIYTV